MMRMLEIGSTIGGYRLLRELGYGGFGTVFEAEDERSGVRVALKALQADLTNDLQQRMFARFIGEVQAVRRIQHANVVRIHDAGKGQDARGRALAFFAMDLLAGGTLEQRIQERGPLSPAASVPVVLDAAAGLDAAHQQKIVHRDIKPANILFDASGRAVVADFGVCKFAEDQNLTLTGQMVGTMRYLAPEQALGEPVEPPADVFALGLVIFFMTTGEHLRAGSDLAAVFRGITLGEDVRRVQDSGLPTPLQSVLLKALAVSPADRFSGTVELGEAWQDACAALDPELRDHAPGASPAAPSGGTSTTGSSLPLLGGDAVELIDPNVGDPPEDAPVIDAPVALAADGTLVGDTRPTASMVTLPESHDELELADGPLHNPSVRCEFCGLFFDDDAQLAIHLDGCRMRRWHERNFEPAPMAPVVAPALALRADTPAAPEPQGWLNRMKGWLGQPRAAPVQSTVDPDDIRPLRDELLRLQDPTAVRLGTQGLELLSQMAVSLAHGGLDNSALLPTRRRVTDVARRMLQLCTAIHLGRTFLTRMGPTTIERELTALKARGAPAAVIQQKEALLRESRNVERALQQQSERLTLLVDTLGQMTARLHIAMTGMSTSESRQLADALDGLIRELSVMAETAQEMKKLGLDSP